MSLYFEITDIQERMNKEDYLIMTDKNRDGAADVDLVLEVIEDVEAEVNSYLGVRYTLPLSPVPVVLRRVCVDIALYRLACTSGPVTEEIKERFKAAIQWLEDVAAGKKILSAALENVANAKGPQFTLPNDRKFTRTKLKGLI